MSTFYRVEFVTQLPTHNIDSHIKSLNNLQLSDLSIKTLIIIP